MATETATEMDRPSAAAQRPRGTPVVERKLDQLCACLDEALSSSTRLRGPGEDARLHAEIKARTDFLRSLLAAEGECHSGARPGYLADAEARFAVLEATFEQWSRRVFGAPAADDDEEEEEEEEEKEKVEKEGQGQPPEEEERQGQPEEEDAWSGSSCSCTDSCQEALAGDGVSDHDAEREAMETREEVVASDANAKKREANGTETAGKRTVVQRRWWWRSAAWCGAAGAVAAVAVGLGLAMELAAVAHHNVYVVPT